MGKDVAKLFLKIIGKDGFIVNEEIKLKKGEGILSEKELSVLAIHKF